MKIKRFDNLWAMGLILFGIILVAFYVLKIFFPEIIVGVAEIPQLVEIGNFIQSSKILLHLFNITTGYINSYLFSCACCRVYKLNWKGNVVLLVSLLLLSLVMEFYPQHYSSINFVVLIAVPFLIAYINKCISKEIFASTVICFCLDILFQVFSLVIRDLTVMTVYPNIVTILVLLIDVYIWRVLLYLFYNYKNKKEID